MARLDDALYRAEVEAAEARIAEAKAVLARLVAGSRPEEIEQARATVAEIEAELEDAQRQVQRLEQLALDRFAPQQQLDTARATAAVARARLAVAREALTLAIKGPREEDIAAARARLAAETAALAAARKKLADAQLAAPNPGTVLTRLQEPGNVVQAHTPIYALALDDPVWVRTYIAEPDLGRVGEGTRARILTDSGGVYAGWVGFISPVAEFTPKTVETEELRTSLVYRIRVFAENPDRGLRQGMPVTVELLPSAGPTSEPPSS
jgi:HlyD family secretion protein